MLHGFVAAPGCGRAFAIVAEAVIAKWDRPGTRMTLAESCRDGVLQIRGFRRRTSLPAPGMMC